MKNCTVHPASLFQLCSKTETVEPDGIPQVVVDIRLLAMAQKFLCPHCLGPSEDSVYSIKSKNGRRVLRAGATLLKKQQENLDCSLKVTVEKNGKMKILKRIGPLQSKKTRFMVLSKSIKPQALTPIQTDHNV